jgi:diacylglycerol kinase (ATP)
MVRKRIRSFGCAFRGIRTLLSTQTNARIHLLATVVVVVLGIVTGLNAGEWALIVIAVSMVWAAEGLNSALEFLADHTAPEWHESVGRAKDVAAGAVLLTAIGALAIGLIVFLPHLTN